MTCNRRQLWDSAWTPRLAPVPALAKRTWSNGQVSPRASPNRAAADVVDEGLDAALQLGDQNGERGHDMR
jgi:hypothetical protein